MSTTKKTTSCLGLCYDVLGQVISVLDVVTDVIVCVQYYQKDRMIFFGISLTILILALIAYDITFMLNYSNEKKMGVVALFLFMLPLSPIIPYLMYFTADPESKPSKLLKSVCCFKINLDDRSSTSSDVSKLRQFMESKIMKHLGFIVEALVEAFPQAILQMAAIVIYEEANIIAIISILISMLSVASKSFVFSIASALTMRQLFLNWLSGITDFFGLFFVVSWVFYKPNDEYLQDAFAVIYNVWLYRIYICTLPLVGFSSIFVYVGISYDEWPQRDITSTCVDLCCSRFILMFGMAIVWMCGVVGSTLAFEIMTWVWPCGVLWILGTNRFPDSKIASEFYFTIIGWIKAAQKHHVGSKYKGYTSYTKYQDKCMRLSAFHSIILRDKNIRYWSWDKKKDSLDTKCIEYLDKELEYSSYMNVTMEGLRIHSDNRKQSEFLLLFLSLYGDIWRDFYGGFKRMLGDHDVDCGEFCVKTFFMIVTGILTFISGPIYLLSRIWSLFFPIWIVLYLYFGYNVNIWNTQYIHVFQIVMITIYLSLCMIIWILFFLNLEEQYIMHHIIPGKVDVPYNINENDSNRLLKEITNHYFGIIVVPIRRAIIIDHFGPDLGPIILSYLPKKDEYDTNENVVRVKTV